MWGAIATKSHTESFISMINFDMQAAGVLPAPARGLGSFVQMNLTRYLSTTYNSIFTPNINPWTSFFCTAKTPSPPMQLAQSTGILNICTNKKAPPFVKHVDAGKAPCREALS